MRVGDYEKFHKKGGEYVIPVEVFNEIIEEIEKLEKKIKGLKGLKLRLITSNTAIKKENDRLEDINEELMEERNRLNNRIEESIEKINNWDEEKTTYIENYYFKEDLLEILKGEK